MYFSFASFWLDLHNAWVVSSWTCTDHFSTRYFWGTWSSFPELSFSAFLFSDTQSYEIQPPQSSYGPRSPLFNSKSLLGSGEASLPCIIAWKHSPHNKLGHFGIHLICFLCFNCLFFCLMAWCPMPYELLLYVFFL